MFQYSTEKDPAIWAARAYSFFLRLVRRQYWGVAARHVRNFIIFHRSAYRDLGQPYRYDRSIEPTERQTRTHFRLTMPLTTASTNVCRIISTPRGTFSTDLSLALRVVGYATYPVIYRGPNFAALFP